MSETVNQGVWTSSTNLQPFQSVEQAEAALEEAKSRERQRRKAAKRAAKLKAQKLADTHAGRAALRELASDTRKFSADARVIAAQALIDQATSATCSISFPPPSAK